jgi:hypothetical protein
MKKSFLILAVFVFCFHIASLSQNQKAMVGASGGVSVAHMSTTIDGTKEDNSSLLGFMFSMWVNKPITENIIFRPNLSYVQKGKKRDVPSGSGTNEVTDELRYAELSANFIYNTSGASANFFIGAGPSISFNLPSKRVTNTAGTKTDADIKFGKTDAEDYRGFDYGVNGVAGFSLPGGWFLAVNYNHGIRNLITGTKDGEINNAYFGIQIGRFFPNK